jgi:hypothetical protein
MNGQVTLKEVKRFGRLNIEIAQLKAGLKEIAQFGHTMDAGMQLVLETRCSMEERLKDLIVERRSMIL